MYYIHTMYPECLQIQIKYIINRIHIQNVFCTWSAEQVEQKIWSWSHAWLMSCKLTCKCFLYFYSLLRLSYNLLTWTLTFSSTLLRICGRQSRYSPEIIQLFGKAFLIK